MPEAGPTVVTGIFMGCLFMLVFLNEKNQVILDGVFKIFTQETDVSAAECLGFCPRTTNSGRQNQSGGKMDR